MAYIANIQIGQCDPNVSIKNINNNDNDNN